MGARTDSGNTHHSPFEPAIPSLRATFTTNMGRIHSTPPIRVRTDPLYPLVRIIQYDVKKF